MLRVLVVSDSPTFNTGYANTIRKINDIFLKCGCEVRQIAWGLNEEVFYKYKLYPVPKNDNFGKTIFKNVVEEYLPHIVFSFGDLHNVSWIGMYPNRFFKWWGYFPIDSERITHTQSYIINQMNLPIVYSKTGLNAIVNSGTRPLDIKLIYHGIDTKTFRPLDKKEIKLKYGQRDKFIVGTVGRNSGRKNFPALIKAFSTFAKDKDDVRLYLHTTPIDAGHNLYEFIKQYNIEDKVIITKDLNPVNGISDEQLIEVYNLFDVFVSTTTGEGFGLPLLESQACEVPVLVTDFGACKEFVPKNLRIKVASSYHEPFWDVERAIIDQEDLVDKLEFFYENQHLIPEIGRSCRRFVESWDWKYIEPLFEYCIRVYGGKESASSVSGGLSDFIRL